MNLSSPRDFANKFVHFFGMEKILKEAKNSIEINLASKNNMKNIFDIIKNKKQNLVSAILQQIALEIVIKSSPSIVQDILALLGNLLVLSIWHLKHFFHCF